MTALPFAHLFSNNQKKGVKPIVLLVLDGFGIAPPSAGNAISLAKTPNYQRFQREYPMGELIASGESVGLPANEVGNTEVGHLTLGAGRTIYQDLKRISMSIESGSFYENEAFKQAANHTRSNNSKLHIMGLVGNGNVHSSIDHLYALIDFCKREHLTNTYFHLFTDGRDSAPNASLDVIREVEDYLLAQKVGRIASITGRYYAMDRDRRWERTEKTYKAIVLGEGKKASSASETIKAAYDANITDEFIEPTVLTHNDIPLATIDDNDALIFYNFRIDRPRQLTMALVMPDFEQLKSSWFEDEEKDRHVNQVTGTVMKTFERGKVPKNLFVVTMTEYIKGLPVQAVAYGTQIVDDSLAVILSKENRKQVHMAESEKERFVTFYFDGLREERLPGEDVLIIPSPKVATYDLIPQMSMYELTRALIEKLREGRYHFAVVNFANPDMVAHTGNIKATIEAVTHVDKALGDLERAILELDGTLLITADHGNAEELLSFPSQTFYYTSSKGSTNTEHSNNKVPFVIINRKYQGKPRKLPQGALADVAPTILAMMNIDKPAGMTGRDLLLETHEPAA